MAIRKLTKRNYLGEGYIHQFKNDVTGEIVTVPCTKEEYTRLGEKDGSKYNPTLDGHIWLQSAGGTIKVDTPDTILGVDEYTIIGEEAHIVLSGQKVGEEYKKVPKSMILEVDSIDTTDL